jgi:hypothetical protein
MNLFKNKNIIHTLVVKGKGLHIHMKWQVHETFIQMCNKRMVLVQLITFLKEMYYLDTC